jgi:hypothetical protein
MEALRYQTADCLERRLELEALRSLSTNPLCAERRVGTGVQA